MKLAHLILAHNKPSQLHRLINRLSHEDADVYIHLDAKSDIGEFDCIKHLPNTYFIKKRVKLFWCEYSTIQATLNGFEEILETGISYSHINLLSGHDYPLQSASTIHRFLYANSDKTFMWYQQIFNDWPDGQRRMKTYYLGDYAFPGRYYLTPLINAVLPKRKVPGNLIPYGRAQWLTITPVCANYVIKYIKEHPALERFFRMTWAVDEVFFQTILCNSPFRDTLVNDNLRYVVLNADYRPATLTMADAEALSSSGKFYARKFDSDADSAILDYLDPVSIQN